MTEILEHYNSTLMEQLQVNDIHDHLACDILRSLLAEPITKDMLRIFPYIINTIKNICHLHIAPKSKEVANIIWKKWKSFL